MCVCVCFVEGASAEASEVKLRVKLLREGFRSSLRVKCAHRYIYIYSVIT